MFPSTVLNMAPNAAITILFILGEMLHKNVFGSECFNPPENLHKNKTLEIQTLLKILNVSQWTYFEANTSNQNTQRGIDQTPPRKRTLELCFLTTCFNVKCSCVDAKKATSLSSTTDKDIGLRTGGTSLICTIFNTRINGAKNKLEKQNITQKRGEILNKNVHGGTCDNPLENLHRNKTLENRDLLKILNVLHWPSVEENNLSEKIQLEMNQTFPQKKTLKICFLTMCFDVNCSCVDANKATLCKTSANKTAPPRNSDTSLYCMGLRTKITETKNELEEQNINQCKQTEDVQDDDVFFSNVTNELYTQMRDFRFHPLPLAISFILGTVFGCVINIFTILFCRNRQSKKQIDSLENIQLYSKFVGETSAYSEISESNQNGQELADAVANTGEYMEPISKNTILQKALTSLADQEENRENNAYFTLTLDRRQADGDGYNHLKPNTGRLPTSPVNQEHDSLYHTMVGAESEIAQVDNEPAENPAILEKDTDDGCNTQSPDAESKSVQGESLQDERPYSVCIHVRDITGNDDPDSEMQERNENTNTDDAYFVLEKQIV